MLLLDRLTRLQLQCTITDIHVPQDHKLSCKYSLNRKSLADSRRASWLADTLIPQEQYALTLA